VCCCSSAAIGVTNSSINAAASFYMPGNLQVKRLLEVKNNVVIKVNSRCHQRKLRLAARTNKPTFSSKP
jgi:hypothetical protein